MREGERDIMREGERARVLGTGKATVIGSTFWTPPQLRKATPGGNLKWVERGAVGRIHAGYTYST